MARGKSEITGGTDGGIDASGNVTDGSSGPIDPAAAFAGSDSGIDGTDGTGTGSDAGTGTDGKRARKKRAPNGSRASSAKGSVSVSGIESVLFSAHTMLAAAIKAPELMLTKEEAHGLAEAAAEVARHYPTEIDPKLMAWVNLAMAMGMVYGPRVYMIRKRRKEDRPPPDNVMEFPGTFPNPGA